MKLAELQKIFQACGVGWVFAEAPEERAQQILAEMREVGKVYEQIFHRPMELALEQAIARDTPRFKPLVQSFASPMTTNIRTMIYCLLQGAQVRSLQVNYEYCHSATLRVEVEVTPGETLPFESTELWDFEALRHFGLMKMGNKPVVDGYYSFGR